MAAGPKEKFDAAVKVIQTLPKNGQFVPSHTLMLKFYAYFKQATIGPCDIPRPGFWDVIGKAKWDAWNKLGHMAKEEAMSSYVEELKKVLKEQNPQGYDKQEIVEAMPHTQMVQEFVQKLDNFYELVDEKPKINGDAVNIQDLEDAEDELIMADLQQEQQSLITPIKATKKPPGGDDSSSNPDTSSPSHSESSPTHMNGGYAPFNTGSAPFNGDSTPLNGEPVSLNGGPAALNGHDLVTDRLIGESDSEGEEFCDTSDSPQSQREDLYISEETYTKPLDQYDHNYNRDPITASGQSQWLLQNTPGSYDHASIQTPWLVQDASTAQLSHEASSAELMFSPSQMNDRQWSSASIAGMTSDPSLSDMLTLRGGGDTPGTTPSLQREGSSNSVNSQGRGSGQGLPSSSSRRSHLLSAGGGARGGSGAGGGGGGAQGNNPPPSQYRQDVNQQIAVALMRLQQDMSSVLSRLNTLETLTVAQHQKRSRENSGSSQQGGGSVWWWPFGNVQPRTLFLILVWPFIVNWIIRILSRRRNRPR